MGKLFRRVVVGYRDDRRGQVPVVVIASSGRTRPEAEATKLRRNLT